MLYEWRNKVLNYIYIIKQKTYFNWSTGKDAAMAFYYLQQDADVEIGKLLITINKHHQRVSMHGLPTDIMHRQIYSLGLPVEIVALPQQPTMDEYDRIMQDAIQKLGAEGYTHTAFGDIFLEDLRTYRESQLNEFGIACKFPLWKRNTTELINEFVDLGFKAIVICANDALLGADFVGKEIDKNFLNLLPKGVDPCGENGEFHTFCYDGPIFLKPIDFFIGEKTYREYDNPNGEGKTGFWFLDLE